jgi:hypothetical protein
VDVGGVPQGNWCARKKEVTLEEMFIETGQADSVKLFNNSFCFRIGITLLL